MLTRNRRSLGSLLTALVALSILAPLAGCMDRKLKPLNPCLVSGVVRRIEVSGVDQVDLLFVIDSSPSMVDEQEKLKAQIPALVQALTTGVRADRTTFPPAKDIHLGVVTTDMGLPGVNDALPGWQCRGYGQDGMLQQAPGAPWVSSNGMDTWNPDPACATSYPKFITYRADEGAAGAARATAEFACLSQVGPSGCGFEMQLEAALKALTPSSDTTRTFLSDQPGAATLGHGDGFNAGFLRNDASTGISLIAVILVTDEEDCSSRNVDHLRPETSAPPPFNTDRLNLRCAEFPQQLWEVSRYVEGLKALRPGQENLVIFGAIAGVPTARVTAAALSNVDFSSETSRNEFYKGILDDPDMQERVNATGNNLENACTPLGDVRGAKPARRIVQVVQGFGENGVLQSICQESYSGAIDSIVQVISKQLGQVCLPRPLIRDSEGKVGCKVVWELPGPGDAATQAPRSCDQAGFEYISLDEERPNAGERPRCIVNQLPVMNDMPMDGEGWYYDDFSEGAQECLGTAKQRIAFVTKPPNGINVKLECLNEVQSVPQTDTDIALELYQQNNTKPPSIGTDCGADKVAGCNIQRRQKDGTVVTDSTTLLCHPEYNVCVKPCTSTPECPAAWECDDRENTRALSGGTPICVNPICGTD